jgi:hypothetical protein
MKKTTEIAADRARDETKTVLPAEMARGVFIKNSPSLRALKLMHLMIAKAGGRMAEPVRHDMRLSEIRAIDGMNNHTRKSLQPLFEELAATVLTYDNTEAQRLSIGGLMEHTTLDYRDEVSGDMLVSWHFGRMFRFMAEESNHWAILDRQTVFHLQSKYSVLLFQYFASLQGLKYKTGEVFTVQQLRDLLGIPKGKLASFGHFNSRAIQPAISEINQLARFTLTATPHKIGRTVATVEITWEQKPDITKAKRELDGSKLGRKARRSGVEETPVIAFPKTGVITYDTHWAPLARKYGSNNDINKIADSFRNWWKPKPLDKKGVEKAFISFCKGLKPPT